LVSVKSTNNRAWFLVIPALLLLGFVAVIPLLMVVDFSLHDVFIITSKVWVGLEFYIKVLSSSRFWESFGRTLFFSAIILFTEIPLGIAIAVSMPKKGAMVAVCLVFMSLPLLVPWNMIPMIWTGVLNILEKSLATIGIDFNWKLNAFHTWIAIVLMDVWHWTSLVVFLCYSSLTTIPAAFYQTAAIDGASRWDVFRYIELPKMRGVLLMAILLRFMDSFMIWTEIYYLNAGGPLTWTMFLGIDLGEEVLAFDYSPAATRGVIYFIIIVAVSWMFKTALAAHKSDNKYGKKITVDDG
jgi:glycerol transport system permease protein